MTVLKTILMIVFIVISIAITVIVLLQEGKQAGLGSISGQTSNNESYWNRNKKHSKEGILVRVTSALVVLFFVLAAVLNIGSF
ncbi:MAG: preprotein translocase subunit SecG [Lachnospiraceae bacterium]|jgi:preprotein translocase subunit SecG|nr:preprotein translocase subunit SecG [Lachnospiraceae bacterium]SEI38224.1 preprotein translocase subunit SecG [Lachnospiraceae bacterium A10]